MKLTKDGNEKDVSNEANIEKLKADGWAEKKPAKKKKED